MDIKISERKEEKEMEQNRENEQNCDICQNLPSEEDITVKKKFKNQNQILSLIELNKHDSEENIGEKDNIHGEWNSQDQFQTNISVRRMRTTQGNTDQVNQKRKEPEVLISTKQLDKFGKSLKNRISSKSYQNKQIFDSEEDDDEEQDDKYHSNQENGCEGQHYITSSQNSPNKRKQLSSEYQILEVLGKGGQGKVATFLDLQNQSIIALKEFDKRDEFERECKIYRFLERKPELHEFVSLMLHANPKQRQIRQKMGSCNLYELYKKMKESNSEQLHLKWQEKHLRYIFIQMVRGLVAFRLQNFFHGDIKPHNVMLFPIDNLYNQYSVKFIDLAGSGFHAADYYSCYSKLFCSPSSLQRFVLNYQEIPTELEVTNFEIYSIIRTLWLIVCFHQEDFLNFQNIYDLSFGIKFISHSYPNLAILIGNVLKCAGELPLLQQFLQQNQGGEDKKIGDKSENCSELKVSEGMKDMILGIIHAKKETFMKQQSQEQLEDLFEIFSSLGQDQRALEVFFQLESCYKEQLDGKSLDIQKGELKDNDFERKVQIIKESIVLLNEKGETKRAIEWNKCLCNLFQSDRWRNERESILQTVQYSILLNTQGDLIQSLLVAKEAKNKYKLMLWESSGQQSKKFHQMQKRDVIYGQICQVIGILYIEMHSFEKAAKFLQYALMIFQKNMNSDINSKSQREKQSMTNNTPKPINDKDKFDLERNLQDSCSSGISNLETCSLQRRGSQEQVLYEDIVADNKEECNQTNKDPKDKEADQRICSQKVKDSEDNGPGRNGSEQNDKQVEKIRENESNVKECLINQQKRQTSSSRENLLCKMSPNQNKSHPEDNNCKEESKKEEICLNSCQENELESFVQMTLIKLAQARLFLRQDNKALQLVDEALTLGEKMYGQRENKQLAQCLNIKSRIYKFKQGGEKMALELQKRCLGIRLRIHNQNDHCNISNSLNFISLLESKLRLHSEALETQQECYQMRKRIKSNSQILSSSLRSFGIIYENMACFPITPEELMSVPDSLLKAEQKFMEAYEMSQQSKDMVSEMSSLKALEKFYKACRRTEDYLKYSDLRLQARRNVLKEQKKQLLILKKNLSQQSDNEAPSSIKHSDHSDQQEGEFSEATDFLNQSQEETHSYIPNVKNLFVKRNKNYMPSNKKNKFYQNNRIDVPLNLQLQRKNVSLKINSSPNETKSLQISNELKKQSFNKDKTTKMTKDSISLTNKTRKYSSKRQFKAKSLSKLDSANLIVEPLEKITRDEVDFTQRRQQKSASTIRSKRSQKHEILSEEDEQKIKSFEEDPQESPLCRQSLKHEYENSLRKAPQKIKSFSKQHGKKNKYQFSKQYQLEEESEYIDLHENKIIPTSKKQINKNIKEINFIKKLYRKLSASKEIDVN